MLTVNVVGVVPADCDTEIHWGKVEGTLIETGEQVLEIEIVCDGIDCPVPV
jgi:hypothetical protein